MSGALQGWLKVKLRTIRWPEHACCCGTPCAPSSSADPGRSRRSVPGKVRCRDGLACAYGRALPRDTIYDAITSVCGSMSLTADPYRSSGCSRTRLMSLPGTEIRPTASHLPTRCLLDGSDRRNWKPLRPRCAPARSSRTVRRHSSRAGEHALGPATPVASRVGLEGGAALVGFAVKPTEPHVRCQRSCVQLHRGHSPVTHGEIGNDLRPV